MDLVFHARATVFTASPARFKAGEVHGEMQMYIKHSWLVIMPSGNEQWADSKEKQYATNYIKISSCSALLSIINHLKNKVICEHFITFI